MENQVPSPDPLPDEDALLREALAFIGDLGSDTDDLSPLDVDIDASNGDLWSPLGAPLESGAVQAVPTSALENDAPPSLVLPASGASKPKANRTRDKRREELLYLREMVRELESKLAQIKRQGDEQKLLEAPGEEARSSVLVRAAWEQVAMSQAVERERVEMENIGLKRLLEEQIQVGKALERLLRKRPKLGDTGQMPRGHPEKRMRPDTMPPSWDDTYIFAELVASCESQYLETPGVLPKVLQLMEGQLNDRKLELVLDNDLGMVLRAAESRILPFDFELATQEFWKAAPDFAKATGTSIKAIEMSDDLIKAQYQAHTSIGRVDGDFTVFIVERRFCEPHRTVITSSGFVDPAEISDMKMDGIHMRLKSWIVFEPIVADAISRPHAPTKAATRMISYSVTVPQVFGGLEDQSRKVGTLTNFLMSAISVELEARQQDFENRLFDRSCARAVK